MRKLSVRAPLRAIGLLPYRCTSFVSDQIIYTLLVRAPYALGLAVAISVRWYWRRTIATRIVILLLVAGNVLIYLTSPTSLAFTFVRREATSSGIIDENQNVEEAGDPLGVGSPLGFGNPLGFGVIDGLQATPDQVKELITYYAAKNDAPLQLSLDLAKCESNYDTHAWNRWQNTNTAAGVYQFVILTWREKTKGTEWEYYSPFDARANIDIATRMIAQGQLQHWACWQR